MDEILNTIGTLIAVIALTIALLTGSPFLRVLSGIGIVYTMFSHDEYLKAIWRKEEDEEIEKYNADIDRFNRDVDEYNQTLEEE